MEHISLDGYCLGLIKHNTILRESEIAERLDFFLVVLVFNTNRILIYFLKEVY